MALRPTPDPEVVPLLKAIKARIEGLGQMTSTPKDGADVYYRNKTPFLQLEIRRDHMSLDLWLSGATLDEARASGIARAHPFLGDEAVKVRFERAEDLSRVARWIEASYAYAPERGKKGGGKKSATKPVVKTTPLIKSIAGAGTRRDESPRRGSAGPSRDESPARGSPPATAASGTSMPAIASTPKNGAAPASATPAKPEPAKPVKPARAKKAASASRTPKAAEKRTSQSRRPSRAKKAAKKAAPKKRSAKRSRR